MGMTIDTIIKDCERRIKQNELFIKVHQAYMEIGEIKEYQHYIERDKLTIETMRKYEKIQETYERFQKDDDYHPVMAWLDVMAVIEDGNDD